MNKTINKKQGSLVGLAFAFAAFCSAAIVAATPLMFPTKSDQATFMVFWSTLFTFAGIFTGLNLELTREVAVVSAQANHPKPAQASGDLRPAWVVTTLGLILAALLALTSPWWSGLLFPSQFHHLAIAVAIGVAGLGLFHGAGGCLAGANNWASYSALTAADSALRVMLVAALAITTRSIVATAIGAAVAFGGAALFTVVLANTRVSMATRTQVRLTTLLARFGAAALASGSSAIMVIGFPTLLALAASTEIYDDSPLLLALTLTRAPLMLPVTAVQGVVVAHFARNRSGGLKAMWPIFRVALLVGILATAGAWLLGPWLLVAIWGPEYIISGPILGALTLGATALAVLSLTGALCQSQNLHKWFVGGWLSAVLVAVLVLQLPLTLQVQTALALNIGPLCGIVIHLVALHRDRP